MRATSEVLEENKVKIAVEVDEDEVEAAVATAAKSLARQVKIPGFRPGKAPRQVVEARIGGPRALRDEALRELLPDYYARAISATEVEPISSPELNVTKGEEEGPVEFDAVVEVRPQIRVTGYDALRVTIPSPLATDDELDQLLDQLRETDAVLTDVARPIVTGDYVTVDVRGRDAEGTEVVSVDDYVYVVGQGSFVDTADDQLPGMRAGETLEVAGTAPGGAEMSYSLALKDVRERVLPELTDEWVEENSEFATAQELRDSSLERINTYKRGQARRAMRDAAMAELAGQVADVDVPDTLLEAETRERFSDFQHNLESQGATIDQFFEVTHQTPDDLVAMLRDEALRSAKIDLALRAVAQDEQLEPTPESFDEEIARLAASSGHTPSSLRDELARNGRLGSLRAAVTKQLAADWVLERVIYVDETGSVVDRSLLEADEDGDDTTDGADGGTGEGAEQVDQTANENEEHQ
ncbi:MAG TPA: trigger factor [Acidimicrobiales bacterium]|jgi:trigger factor|nr:trigger factor [Acidimicrobiales bacterium]